MHGHKTRTVTSGVEGDTMWFMKMKTEADLRHGLSCVVRLCDEHPNKKKSLHDVGKPVGHSRKKVLASQVVLLGHTCTQNAAQVGNSLLQCNTQPGDRAGSNNTNASLAVLA